MTTTSPLATHTVEGNILPLNWVDQFGSLLSDGATSVAVDAAGNVYTAGYTEGSYGGPKNPQLYYNNDTFLTKYSPTGVEQWIQRVGHPELDDQANAIAVDAWGNVYVTGSTRDALLGFGGTSDVFVMKFSSSGKQLWEERFGGSTNDVGRGITVDAAGNVYITGEFAGYGSANAGNSNAFLAKYSSTGDQLWVQQANLPNSDIAYDVAVDGAGGVFIAGSTGGSLQGTRVGFTDAFLMKFDQGGNYLWHRVAGADYEDSAQGVAVDNSGNVYVAGYIQTGRGHPSDTFIAKYTNDGSSLWADSYSISEGDDRAQDIVVDLHNNVYVTGEAFNTIEGLSAGSSDVYLLNVNAESDIVGVHRLSTNGSDIPGKVAVDRVGNVYVAGYTEGVFGDASEGYNDGFVIKFGNIPLPDIDPPDDGDDPGVPGEVIRGTNRSERLRGGAGNDTLIGNGGNDVLAGLAGDDILNGGQGNDILRGGAGNDRLDGGKGRNILIGNGGADRFLLRRSPRDFDQIKSFQDGVDQFVVRGINPNRIRASQDGNQTILSLGNDVLAAVTGIRAGQINRADFTS